MFPVCGKPGIGTAEALIVIVGAADACAATASSATPTSNRHLDTLRICLASIPNAVSWSSPTVALCGCTPEGVRELAALGESRQDLTDRATGRRWLGIAGA